MSKRLTDKERQEEEAMRLRAVYGLPDDEMVIVECGPEQRDLCRTRQARVIKHMRQKGERRQAVAGLLRLYHKMNDKYGPPKGGKRGSR